MKISAVYIVHLFVKYKLTYFLLTTCAAGRSLYRVQHHSCRGGGRRSAGMGRCSATGVAVGVGGGQGWEGCSATDVARWG